MLIPSITSKTIASATYRRDGSIAVELVDQPPETGITVPDDMTNRDRVEIAEWEAAGNSIEPYDPANDPLGDGVPETKPAEPTPTEKLILAELARITERLDAIEAK